MKKIIGFIGGLILVSAVCMAGVKTDKVVFGDDTEMTTAAGGGTPPATNTTTIQFSQGVYIDGDAAGYDVYVGVDEANDAALRTEGNGREAKLSYYDGFSDFAAVFTDGSGQTVYVGDGSQGIYVTGGNFDVGIGLATEGIAINGSGKTTYLGQTDHAGYFYNGSSWSKLATGSEAFRAEDDALSKSVSLIDANYAINVAVGDVHFYDDEVKYMQNAAGGEVSWTQWAAGDTKDADGSWRMGVVNSNFVIQVRVSGAWTNATVFMRP